MTRCCRGTDSMTPPAAAQVTHAHVWGEFDAAVAQILARAQPHFGHVGSAHTKRPQPALLYLTLPRRLSGRAPCAPFAPTTSLLPRGPGTRRFPKQHTLATRLPRELFNLGIKNGDSLTHTSITHVVEEVAAFTQRTHALDDKWFRRINLATHDVHDDGRAQSGFRSAPLRAEGAAAAPASRVVERRAHTRTHTHQGDGSTRRELTASA